ncbi:MAG: TrkA family potassium uptake protein [Fimbriimonadaceae bacterium]|nr:MAG: TrkA family potassium uptake protein [Fimbriimonadaceae bacterium]
MRGIGQKKSELDQEFAVIGLGRFGTSVAKTLVESGHTVLGIDSDVSLVQRYSHMITQTVALDSTDEEALKEIDIQSYDTVIVAIGTNFEANLMTTVALKSLGIKTVVCKATTEIQRNILKRVGADRIVLPEFEAGERLAMMITSPTVVSQMVLCPGTRISEVLVPKAFVDKNLDDADIPGRFNLSVVAIQRGTTVMPNPKKSTILRAGDMLVVIGPHDAVQKLSAHV